MLKALVFATLLVAAMSQWTNCGNSADHFTISDLTINPNPIVRGQNVTIALSGSLNEQITGGTASISVYYLGVKVFSHTYQICTDLQPDVTCPVAAGPVTFSLSELFPSYVPKGTYSGNIEVVDQNNQEVACVNFKMGVSMDAEDAPVLSEELIAAVNADAASSWKAGKNARFEGLSIKEAKKILGTKLRAKEEKPFAMKAHATAIPTSFDSRTQWPTCVHPIRDQQQCGSCWAFGASEALSDRLCIATSGATNIVLSPEDLVSCDTTNYGCDGGYLDAAWQYMATTGIVSDACFPYTAGSGVAPACISKCVDGSAWVKHKVASGSIIQPADVASIQTTIMNAGPIEVAFTVYQDFMSYTSGVYVHKSGSELGGHAVKNVGWGVTSTGIPYWIIANSWGTSWGMNGFFWIKRGVDECGIEDNAIAGTPVA